MLTLFNIVDNEDTSTVEQRRSGAPSSCPVRPFLSGRTSSSASFRLHRCTRISFILPRTPLITVTRRQSGLRADRPALRSQTVVGPYRPAARTPEVCFHWWQVCFASSLIFVSTRCSRTESTGNRSASRFGYRNRGEAGSGLVCSHSK